MLSKNQARNPQWDRVTVDAFLRSFSKHEENADAAFDELVKHKLGTRPLANLARAVGAAGRPALAFRLLAKLNAAPSEQIVYRIWAYDVLKKTDGEEKALTWLRTAIPPSDTNYLDLFQFQRYDLLWTLFPENPNRPKTKNDQLALLRTVSLLCLGAGQEQEQRRAQLIAYFEGRPREDFVPFGLYLLGRIDRDELFKHVKDLSNLATLGWILGVKEAAAGRYEEASGWLQVAVETGLNTLPPQAWSYELLRRWYDQKAPLKKVQAAHVL